MSNSDLDELAAELAEFAPPEKKGGRPASEERVIAGFEEIQRFTEQDRKSTRLNSSHIQKSRMPSSA